MNKKFIDFVRILVPSEIEMLLRYHKPVKSKPSYFENINNKKRVFIFLAADYGNLGDIAITEAQKKFIKRALPEYEVISIPYSVPISTYKQIKKNTNNNDIVTIIGGGNLGDMYPSIQDRRNLIIRVFKDNPIISFPQTIDFSDTNKGKLKLKEASKNISKHNNISIFAREEKSYLKMQEYFPKANNYLVPDIVLSDKVKINHKREDNRILTCLRNDQEKAIPNNFDVKSLVEKFVTENNLVLNETDTHIGNDNLEYNELKVKYYEILNEFAKSKLVITDRLHGVIFCYLTKTPCLFFDNTNKKVSGVFEWIKDCQFIKMTNDSEFETDLKYFLYKEKPYSTEINSLELTREFSSLDKILKRYGNEK